MFQWMRTLTQSSKHERSGHSRSLSFPSVCVWQRDELTTSHRVEDKCLNHFKNILKKREVQSTLDRVLTSPLAKRQRPATEEDETYLE